MTIKKLTALRAKYRKAVVAHDAMKQYAAELLRRATTAQAIEIQKDLLKLGLKKALWAAEKALRAERVSHASE